MLVAACIFSVLILYYVAYLVRCAWFWGKVDVRTEADGEWPMVTVIVPARNEAAGVGTCVRTILAQDYPQACMELILVNDHSEDDTVTLAMAAAQGDARFRCIDLEAQTGTAYKKAAVARGIAAAQGSIIVTTDADCHMGTGWLRAMVQQFDGETDLVSGPVALEGEGAFAQMQALEFMGLIAVGAAGIAAGSPNMCNGANLAYRKAAFEAVGGFAGIDHIASGDDELLMHRSPSGARAASVLPSSPRPSCTPPRRGIGLRSGSSACVG
jgi:biofilm PGA synthesis N-glycosyltransferase PgaC